MSNEKHHNFAAGVSLLTGILGTLSSFMKSRAPVKNLTESTKDAAVNIKECIGDNKRLLLGGVAGGLIGAAAALLFAPKAGSELVSSLFHSLKREEKSTSHENRKSTSSKAGKHLKDKSQSDNLTPPKKRKGMTKATEKKLSQKLDDKKNQIRRKKREASSSKPVIIHEIDQEVASGVS